MSQNEMNKNAMLPFDEQVFRSEYPAFAEGSAYSTSFLQGKWNIAHEHIVYGKRLAPIYPRVISLLTAHLVFIEMKVKAGDAMGVLSSATVDKVSVSLTPPPIKNQREYWYSLSPYGLELMQLLKHKVVGGLFIGGAPSERGGFRKAGGVFESLPVEN